MLKIKCNCKCIHIIVSNLKKFTICSSMRSLFINKEHYDGLQDKQYVLLPGVRGGKNRALRIWLMMADRYFILKLYVGSWLCSKSIHLHRNFGKNSELSVSNYLPSESSSFETKHRFFFSIKITFLTVQTTDDNKIIIGHYKK